MAKLKNKISLETSYNYILKKHHHNFEFMIYGKKFNQDKWAVVTIIKFTGSLECLILLSTIKAIQELRNLHNRSLL
ncbi:unnamed protein product, partial [Vitis vinifera]|uniref:Uncharacterized protein n=1 Tax=Vitis vinifera TaxID=29760 RepID=D7TVD5_VITVI